MSDRENMATSKLIQIKRRYLNADWNIGIGDITDDLSISNLRWLKHNYKDRWFADPFILSEDSANYTIFVEEMLLRQGGKARLAKLTVDKSSFSLVRNEVLLELPTHLSFPNTICEHGKIYLQCINSKVIVDGYRYRARTLRNIYMFFRTLGRREAKL